MLDFLAKLFSGFFIYDVRLSRNERRMKVKFKSTLDFCLASLSRSFRCDVDVLEFRERKKTARQ